MVVCQLSFQDDDLFSKIIEIERQYINNPEECIRSSEKDVENCLLSGCSYGVFDNGELVAFSLCYHSDYCTGYIDKCFVVPEYRGNKIQQTLLKKNIEALRVKGVDEVFAMVAPKNIASVRSFWSVGFEIKKNITFDNVERILLKMCL